MRTKALIAAALMFLLFVMVVSCNSSYSSTSTSPSGPATSPSTSSASPAPTTSSPLPASTSPAPVVTSPLPSSPVPAPIPVPTIYPTTLDGTIASRQGDIIVVSSASGNVTLELISSTLVQKADGSTGAVADVQAGVGVQVIFRPNTRIIAIIIVKSVP